MWLMVTALAAFAVAYRLYGAFLAARVAVINDTRSTPAHRLKDGVDYHPTKRLVLFGHHFAAIAGPGPLIGPVLAAQWGYFPGFTWIVIGACIAGGVHDFVTLVASVRQDGMTLSNIARKNLGPISGMTTAVATLFIVIAVLSSVAMVVVKALNESSWGMFTILATIPAALLTGAWMYKIRPGRVGEASVIGVTIVLLGVYFGKPFAESHLGPLLLFHEDTLKVMLPTYAAVASILPVWVLMCPRDYLSSYMKIGVIVLLAAGIFIVQPHLKMPATTPFLSGGGPVVSGPVWPFVSIVIMCGALSGFHALIASGTTPKMIYKESDMLPIGYGAMILEGFVALTALVAACALEPGDYFAINSSPEKLAAASATAAGQVNLAPVELQSLEEGVKEKLAGRTGGAVTLAVGMARVFSSIPGMKAAMDYWYHFVIMFEALFILTLLETGTRVARFVFQETVAQFTPKAALGHQPNWAMNVIMSIVVCGLWGGLLYIGNLDTLWRMLGIANQLLATIALSVGTTYLLRNAPKRVYALCTGVPWVFVVATVFTAGVWSVQTWWAEGVTAAAAGDASKAFLARLASVLAGVMLVLTGVIIVDTVRRWYEILRREPVRATQATAVPEAGA
jgi:carbon starvation protein